MKIAAIEALPIIIPRDLDGALGTAGSPTLLQSGHSSYRWSKTYPCLYSSNFETALVKVTTDDGLTGWGESQAPVAPLVACTIVDLILKPVLVGEPFHGTISEIQQLWWRMYSTMRVRGQTGGFMLDAISGVDLALWDLAGKISGRPVADLLGGEQAKKKIPAYVSGLPNSSVRSACDAACRYAGEGFTRFKVYFDRDGDSLFRLIDAVREELGGRGRIAVDALWRLTPDTAVDFGSKLDERDVMWLESPLGPEDPLAHGALARALRTPIAIGESYRSCYELAPFFRESAFRILQPDLGRCGISEGIRLAELAAQHSVAVAPHVSIALGPQLAAALHYAAALSCCNLVEFNPAVVEVANRFLREPLHVTESAYVVPQGPGFGIEMDEDLVRQASSP